MNVLEAHPGWVSSQLAEYLQANKAPFMARWVERVRRDSGVPSDLLTRTELIDHVPVIFDAIIRALMEHRRGSTMEQVQEIAARHTIIRWVQDYDLRAVLKELSLLRTEFICHLRAFEEEQPLASHDQHLIASTTIHRILDGIMMDAVDTFLTLRTRATADEA